MGTWEVVSGGLHQQPQDSSFWERRTTSRLRAGRDGRRTVEKAPVGARGATRLPATSLMSKRRRKLVRIIVSCACSAKAMQR